MGNARISFAKNSAGNLEVTDTNNYYAFGMNHIGGIKSSLGAYKNYKYNGKELQETGMYDYGARMYMPDLGRWGVVDPLAEKYRRWSPYNYAVNNPVRFIDPDGRGVNDIIIQGSKNDQKAYLLMLNASTGNNYSLDSSGKLQNNGSDKNFKGSKSSGLARIIDKGITSSSKYELSLTGGKSDNKEIFIDSYSEKKVDISDLQKLGSESLALQGAAIGHFLNEVQESGDFDSAHKASLDVEGNIFGELVGDSTITTRKDYATGAPQNGFQTVIYEYNSKNKFQIQQGANSTSKGTGQFFCNLTFFRHTQK